MMYFADALSEAIKAAAAWAAPALCAGVLAWWAVKRKAVAANIAARRAQREAMAALPGQLQVLVTSVSGIEKQIRPNGGGSLMDAVVRIEREGQNHGRDLQQLRSSLEGIEAVVRAQGDLATEGSFVCDSDGSNISVNLTYARMLGVGRDDLQGNRWKGFIHPDDSVAFLQKNAQALSDHRMFTGRCRLVRSDGDIITVDVTIIPEPDHPPARAWYGKVRLVV